MSGLFDPLSAARDELARRTGLGGGRARKPAAARRPSRPDAPRTIVPELTEAERAALEARGPRTGTTISAKSLDAARRRLRAEIAPLPEDG